jgi:hypothetical protein
MAQADMEVKAAAMDKYASVATRMASLTGHKDVGAQVPDNRCGSPVKSYHDHEAVGPRKSILK